MMIRVVFLLCLLKSSLQQSDVRIKQDIGEDSGSQVHYFGFFNNGNEDNADLKLILFNTGTQSVSFTIDAPGIHYVQSGIISANKQKTVDIPSKAEVSSVDDQNKGIYLTTTSDGVIAIGQSSKGSSIDTFTLQPVANLNVDKYTYYSISTSRQNNEGNSIILVVGSVDSTTMELTVTQQVQVKIGGTVKYLVPDKPYLFVLDRIQTVYISSKEDLSGSKIVTNKPVSVFNGHSDGHIEIWARSGYIAEQIPPTAYWDKVFYFVTTGGISEIRVLGAEDGTNVALYCNGIRESHIINEGKTFNKMFNSRAEAYCAVHSDKPVLVTQQGAIVYTESTFIGDPMLVTVPGTNQYTNTLYSSTLTLEDPSKKYHHYFNLIVLAEYYQPDMIHLTQGIVTHTLSTGDWRPISVDHVSEAYALQLSIIPGPYSITHDNPAAKMTFVSFGTGDVFGGYGHSAQFKVTQVLPLCQPLEDIDDGRVECSLGDDGVPTEGDTCIYVCDEGFVVIGDTVTRECQSDGTWSGSEPTCERVLCYQLEAPDNGKMECTGNHYQDVCSFSCDEGYELTGSDTRTCQSDANWSGSDAECVPGSRNRKQKKAAEENKKKAAGENKKKAAGEIKKKAAREIKKKDQDHKQEL